MKTCFVKSACITPLSWESLRYPGPRKLLDSLPFGSLDFSLMVKFQSDTWVIPRDDIAKGGTSCGIDSGLLAKLECLHQNIVPVSEIPWGDYDCVISYFPILGEDIIKRYPRVLWCYKEIGINKRMEEALKKNRPYGGYDLFLEERLRATDRLERIPQVIAYPYAQNSDIMRELIVPRNEPAVFIDPRNIPQRERGRVQMRAEFSNICSLPIRHAPFPDFNTMLPKFTFALVSDSRKKILRTADYLDLVGSCKYHLSWRRRQIVGQALIEAAGLGLIIVAPKRSPYSRLLCHPSCLTQPAQPPENGARIIGKIEKDPDWQAEILAHQDKILRERFWNRPLEILDNALKMKRRK